MKNLAYISLGIAMFIVLVSIAGAGPALFDDNMNYSELTESGSR